MRLLVANRGEIARRVMRTARDLGWTTVAVFASPDADAAFVNDADIAVPIGGPDLAESYLNADRILEACAAHGVTALHPGYGFLSENADFARRVVDAGIAWVGPHPEAIASMGSKIDARAIAERAGVPLIPGFGDAAVQDDATLAEHAGAIGYPILVKAAAGGGGKGIRIAHSPEQFATALAEARTEAARSFGDDAVIVERYIERPRHVEVQIIGDQFGTVLELGTRDCSVQRRYQKLVEEAPAPNLEAHTDEGLRSAAVRLGAAMGYDNAGTVEFVVDADTGDFFFLEVNTRLQVEHPVTEAITGLDLVELQLLVATGHPLPLTQDQVLPVGHAVEVRINAEDPAEGYAPQTGPVELIHVPVWRDGVRWDGAFDDRGEVSPFYDSMVAKLIVHGSDRAGALSKLASVLDDTLIGPLRTNVGLHRWLIDQPEFAEGRVTTRFLDEHPAPPPPDPARAVGPAGRAVDAHRAATGTGPWGQLADFSVLAERAPLGAILRDHDGDLHDYRPPVTGHDALTRYDPASGLVCVNVDGHTVSLHVVDRADAWAADPSRAGGAAGDVIAPFPAVVVETPAAPGATVAAGDTVVVVEAMKMLHSLTAPGPGTVAEVRVSLGDTVETNQVLVTFTAEDQQ